MTPSPLRPAGLPGLALAVAGGAVFAASVAFRAALAPVDRWALAVGALALFVAGLSVRRGAGRFGLLAALFLAGGAAQFYLTEPIWGPTLRLRPQDPRDLLAMAVIVAEVVAALAVIGSLGIGTLASRAGRWFGWGRIAIFLALTTLFASPVLSYADRGAGAAYAAHLVAGGALATLHLAVLIAMALVPSPVSGHYRLSPIAPAVFTVAASLALGALAFQHLPHTPEEVAWLFQAKGFASGALSLPAPPEAAQPGLVYPPLEIRDGRWFAATPPGWPLALAPFVALGVPWIVNPVLAGLSVLLAHAIARRRIGRDQADVVALMMASSPWLLAAAGSFMPQTLTLALMLFSWWMVLRAETTDNAVRRLAVAGVAAGWIVLARPLDGLLIGALTAFWAFAGPRGSPRRAGVFGLGWAGAAALLPVYNLVLTGSPFGAALSDAPGGPAASGGAGAGGGLIAAVQNTIDMAASVQFELLGWSVGSLALVYAFFLWEGGKRTFDWVMVAVAAAFVATTVLLQTADTAYLGPTEWFLAIFPLLYLATRGCEALKARLPEGGGGEIRVDSIVLISCLYGLLVFAPWRGIVKYHEYGGFRSDLRTALDAGAFGNAIVLIPEHVNPGAAFALDDPAFAPDRPIFLLDRGNLDEAALRAAFPGREILRHDPAAAEPSR